MWLFRNMQTGKLFFFISTICGVLYSIAGHTQLNLLQSAFSNTGIVTPLPLAYSAPADKMQLWCQHYYSQQARFKVGEMQNNLHQMHWQTIRKICDLQLSNDASNTQLVLPNVLQYKLYFQEANTCFQQKKYYEAIALYKKVPTTYLTNLQIVEKNFNMAYSYLVTNQQQEVGALMASVVNIKGDYFQSGNYYYGLLKFYNGDYEQALQSFERIKNDKEYQKVVPYYISSIYYYSNKKDFALEKALGYLNAEKADIYFREELNMLVGQIYFENKNYDKAIPYFEDYLADASSIRREDLFLLGFSNYQIGNIAKAQDVLSRVSEDLDTISHMTNYVLGDCYLKKGNKEDARESFQKALNIDGIASINEESRFQVASLSYEMGIDDDALNGAYNLVQKFPNSTHRYDCIKMIGNVLMNTKNYEAALKIMREFSNAPEIKKAHQKIAFNQAVKEINKKEWKNALELLQESDANSADNSIANESDFWKGEVAYQQKDYSNAVQYADKFIKNNKKAKAEANVNNANLLKCYVAIKTGKDSIALQALNNIYKSKDDKYLMKNAIELTSISNTLDNYFAIESKNNDVINNVANLLDNKSVDIDKQIRSLDSLQNVKPYQLDKIAQEKAIWQLQKGNLQESIIVLNKYNAIKNPRIFYYTLQNKILLKQTNSFESEAKELYVAIDTTNEWQAKTLVLLFDDAVEKKDSINGMQYLDLFKKYSALLYAKARIPIKAKMLKNVQLGIVPIIMPKDTIGNKNINVQKVAEKINATITIKKDSIKKGATIIKQTQEIKKDTIKKDPLKKVVPIIKSNQQIKKELLKVKPTELKDKKSIEKVKSQQAISKEKIDKKIIQSSIKQPKK